MTKYWHKGFWILGAWWMIFPLWAATELDLNYSLERKTYGENSENKVISQTYYASLAYYFFSSTAIEINGSFDHKKTTTTMTAPLPVDSAALYGSINKLKTWTYGVGLRQALASPAAKIRPLLGFGWARQRQNEQNFYLMDLGGGITQLAGVNHQQEQDVAYVLAALRFTFSAHWAFKLSAVGTFKPFHWKEIDRDIRYLGGLMIIF